MDQPSLRGSFIPVSQAAARQLQQRLADKTFPPGSQLPSQRDLALEFGVSRPSMREAILTLETLGLLRTEPGRGTFVVDPADPATASAAGITWLRGQRMGCGPAEVFQTRLLLEPALAAGCAARRDPALPATLAALTEAMEAAWADRDLITHAAEDFRFHSAVAAGSGNPLLIQLYQTAGELIRDAQRVAIPVTDNGRMTQSLAEHRAIGDAIAAGDARSARAAMDGHIRHTALQSGLTPDDLALAGDPLFPLQDR